MSSEHKINKTMLNMTISFLIMLIFYFLPPVGEITVAGMQVLGSFLGALYGWMTVGLLWPSIMGLLALAFSDITDIATLYTMGFANENVVLIFTMLFIACFINEIGLADWIVVKMTTTKIINGRPYLLLTFWTFACFLISLLTASMVTAVLAVTFFRSIAKNANAQPYSEANAAFLCAAGLAIGMGAICLPFKAAALIILGVYTGITGGVIEYTSYFYCILPCCILVLVTFLICCKFILRIDLSAFSKCVVAETNPLTKRQKISLGLTIVLLLLFILPGIMPEQWGITVFLNTLGTSGICFGFIAILLFLHVEGKPLMDFNQSAKEFSWDTYIFTIYIMPICSLLGNAATGINTTLTTLVTPITNVVSPTVAIIIFTALAALLTNFLNNMPVAVIFITLICSAAGALDEVNLYAASVAIMIACYLSVMTPVASGYNAVICAANDLIEIKKHMFFCFKALIGIVVVLCLVIYPLASFLL